MSNAIDQGLILNLASDGSSNFLRSYNVVWLWAAQPYTLKLCSCELNTVMASRVTQGLLFVQDENQVAHRKSTISSFYLSHIFQL